MEKEQQSETFGKMLIDNITSHGTLTDKGIVITSPISGSITLPFTSKIEKPKFKFEGFNKFTNYLEIAESFWQEQPFFYDKCRIWWLWNHREYKWERVDEIDLHNAIDSVTKFATTDSTVKTNIIESLKRIGRKHKPQEASKFWIQFKNNIYDIKDGGCFEATPSYFVTNPIPWDVGDTTETPEMERIFKEWMIKEGVQDISYVDTLYEIMAYCMLSYMPIHRIFCFSGEGLNGKGSFLRLIMKLVGAENTCATELEVLSDNNFESNKLYKKLVCFIGEVDKGVFKKTKTIKSLTGEDLVRVEFKGKDGFDNQNYAKPLIATNHLPETTDKTKGFYRRWTIVDFPNQFSEKKDIIAQIPEIEFNNFCKKALLILKDLIEKGEFTNDGTIEDREERYERHSNYTKGFIKQYCVMDKLGSVEFAEFVERFNEYLVSEYMPKKSKIEIGRLIGLQGLVKKVKMVVDEWGNKTTKVYIFGIKWKEDAQINLTI